MVLIRNVRYLDECSDLYLGLSGVSPLGCLTKILCEDDCSSSWPDASRLASIPKSPIGRHHDRQLDFGWRPLLRTRTKVSNVYRSLRISIRLYKLV